VIGERITNSCDRGPLKNFRRQAKPPIEREGALYVELTLNKLYAIFYCLHKGPNFQKNLEYEITRDLILKYITHCDTSNTTVNHARQFAIPWFHVILYNVSAMCSRVREFTFTFQL